MTAGLQLLPVPDNYYDDLVARFDLDPGRVAELRELSLLYDRDEHGEFVHFYTVTIGELFVEFVERGTATTATGPPTPRSGWRPNAGSRADPPPLGRSSSGSDRSLAAGLGADHFLDFFEPLDAREFFGDFFSRDFAVSRSFAFCRAATSSGFDIDDRPGIFSCFARS